MKLLTIFGLFAACCLSARTLEVGAGRQFARLQAAAAVAAPGDTILIRGGIYGGGDFIANLQGTPAAWITIRAATGEEAVFRGGAQAFHLTDPRYLRIEGLKFEQHTGNGINLDDGGTFDSPAHHIVIERCEWRGMSAIATGNHDELKMSGIDSFTVRNCRFMNGSAGGSLIDMVGCHEGVFTENTFENGGSNCIQAKGGTSGILIERNRFINGGERAINIGGSTGLEFFRPPGARYEASGILVFSNIFVGSSAPVAFVGAVNCEVRNNTIYRPVRWAVRILQETVGNGFLPCGNNDFSNNIVVFASAQPAFNIGGNTAPETFTAAANLWFNPANASWQPNTPVAEPGRITGRNPLFADTTDFRLMPSSPAVGAGANVSRPERDFFGTPFGKPRSIGAAEVGALSVDNPTAPGSFVFPNPASNRIRISPESGEIPRLNCVHAVTGTVWPVVREANGDYDVSAIPQGAYAAVASGRTVAVFIIAR